MYQEYILYKRDNLIEKLAGKSFSEVDKQVRFLREQLKHVAGKRDIKGLHNRINELEKTIGKLSERGVKEEPSFLHNLGKSLGYTAASAPIALGAIAAGGGIYHKIQRDTGWKKLTKRYPKLNNAKAKELYNVYAHADPEIAMHPVVVGPMIKRTMTYDEGVTPQLVMEMKRGRGRNENMAAIQRLMSVPKVNG